MSSLRRRIVAGLGANALGQAVTIGIQLASLPLFLSRWDIATYGSWLMLSALPAFLSSADVGMVSAAGNRMTMAMGRGDTDEARRVFHSAVLFISLVCAALAFTVLPLVAWAPLPRLDGDARLALTALATGVLAAVFGGLSDALFRSTGRYAIGASAGHLVRLGEWAGAMTGLLLVGNFAAVALSGLLVRLLGTLAVAVCAGRGSHGLRWGCVDAQFGEVRELVKPAASFMVFTLANALSFQGMTLLVGYYLGPAVVAVFNAYRTLSRVAVQATAVFSYALWPEFSRLFGQGGANAVAPLYRRSFGLALLMAVSLTLLLYAAAPWLLRWWTHETIAFQALPLVLMLAYAAAGGACHVPRVLLMSVNGHAGLAAWTLAAAALTLSLAATLSPALGLPGAVTAMLTTEFAIAAVCTLLARRLLTGPPLLTLTPAA